MDAWNPDQEQIIEAIRKDCKVLHEHHKKQYLLNLNSLSYYKIPIIIISTLNSVLSVGMERYLQQHYISGLTCILSLLVVIIGSIEQFLGIQKKMELDLITSRDAYFLAIDIFKILSLDRYHRTNDGSECLNEIYARFIKITETSNVIKKKIKDPLLELPYTNPPQIIFSNTNSTSSSELSSSTNSDRSGNVM
jgi:hypothetical protein